MDTGKGNSGLLKWPGLILITILGTSCNSVFYQPQEREFLTPAKANIEYSSQKISTPSGVNLASWWLQAPVAKRKKRLVVQFHGNAENMSTHFLFVAWLVPEGFDVLSFDYRGYGHSDAVSPTQSGLLEDGCAVLAWVQQQKVFEGMPVYVIGQSLGGAVALSTLAHCPIPALKGLVIDSAFSSYRRMARKKLGQFWLSWPLQYPLSFLISDQENPLEAIDKIKVPLLFFHSKLDPVVPYALGRELYDEAPGPKEFVDVDGYGHTAALVDPESPYRQKLLDFLLR